MATIDSYLTWWASVWDPASSSSPLYSLTSGYMGDTSSDSYNGICFFLKWDKDKYPDDCPYMIARSIIENPDIYNNYDVITSPITAQHRKISKKTIRAVMNSFNYDSYHPGWRPGLLVKAECKDGSIYYGAPGILLDENFNMLLLMTTKITKSPYSPHGLMLAEAGCLVNTRVYNNPKGLVEKYIINKIIPNITTTNLASISLVNDRVTKITIKNCDDCIVKMSDTQGEITGLTNSIKNKILEEMINTNEEQEDS